ncbi:iron complex transport system substrate-binding protein [Methanophagales archaeon]|nr:iron complex transport system substrate-binding protein [Methanophagales archaeon]
MGVGKNLGDEKGKKMKTKLNKFLTTIVLCSMLLVALPAIAAATEDETLDIYGNANEDDILDMRDLTFTARMILRLEDETELADANYDGRISVADMTQIGLIILGRESKLILVDATDRIVTVNKPVERLVVHHPSTVEAIKVVGAEDRVVGICNPINEILFPQMSELPLLGTLGYDIYYEEVFELDPDIFITPKLPIPGFDDLVATLEPEITVVALNFYEPATMVENIRKLRYILNTEEDGEAFIAFYEGVINGITEGTAGLSEAEKPRVFLKIAGWTPEALSTFTDTHQTEIAGGINIAADLPGSGFVPEIDTEWLVEQNPDIVTAQIWEVYNPGALGYEVDDNSVTEAAREEIMAMDAFAGGKAVEEGKVYLYEDELMITPRFVVGIAYMAKWFHPTLFSELDPKAIHQEYLTDFMRIDYDLSEHGVFAYPEP